MARYTQLGSNDEALKKDLSRSFQSAHINFLMGAGAAHPAIPVAGPIEQEIANLLLSGKEDEAYGKLYSLVAAVQEPTNGLLTGTSDRACKDVLVQYVRFLQSVERILIERRSGILPRQATVFTTNYDLFLEKAAGECSLLNTNTGFSRADALGTNPEFAPESFFTATYDTGNIYDYRVELPAVNVLKLHGCASWRRTGARLIRDATPRGLLTPPLDPTAVRAFVDGYAVVLPRPSKFNATVLDRTYYELLRLYANQLDKENVLLLAFGFSFRDEHIFGITTRALKNPTLRLVIIAYDSVSAEQYRERFEAHVNVEIVGPEDGTVVDFEAFNGLLGGVLPVKNTLP